MVETATDPNTQPMTKHIAMRIPNSLAERIRVLTSDSGVSTSAFIRTAIVDKVRIEEMALKRLGVDLVDIAKDIAEGRPPD